MDSVRDLIERLEYARYELNKALVHESKLIKQSQKAIKDSLEATKAAAKAANDVINCKQANELAYLKLQSSEKAHYARLFSAISRDAAELASQARKENAEIIVEIKKIAELLAIAFNEDEYFSSESTG
jgi:hypothetical protein